MLVDMKDWLIKKLGGFTRDEYIQDCNPGWDKPIVKYYSSRQVKRIIAKYSFPKSYERMVYDDMIKTKLAMQLANELKDAIKISKRNCIYEDNVECMGELMIVVEDE